MTEPGGRVRIHYRRIPDREQIFDQRVVAVEGGTVITFAEAAPLERPVTASGSIILEPGAPVVWFTFPGVWHDIGRFHLADGTFTGCYANILTPPRMAPGVWHTTDLFLDVWVPADGGEPSLLDEDEFEAAHGRGLIDAPSAARARDEAARLMEEVGTGAWPPLVVSDWTLEAVRRRLQEIDGGRARPDPPAH